MSNFYMDNDDLQATLRHLDLRRVVRLREDNYDQARQFPYAPRDYEDAIDSYGRTLAIVGDIAGEFVDPRAEAVDRAGSQLVDGEVCYAPGISEALERLRQADLMGITLPRRYGGLNFPVSVSVMIVEMVSRADPALMNIFGLQDIAETINKFASDEMKGAYLPRFASGEVTGSMALTEPEAGSDLQNVQLQGQARGRRHLEAQRRQALHHQRLRPHLPCPGALRGGDDGCPRPLDVPLRTRRAHAHPPPRGQARYPRVAHV